MPVEHREYDSSAGHQATVVTECRYCGEDIPDGTGYAEHLAYQCDDSPAREDST